MATTRKSAKGRATTAPRSTKAAAAPPRPKSAPQGNGSGPKPFNTFEEFLFQALTLRSNAAYREDVRLLMEYEADGSPPEVWRTRFEAGDRPYQAAQSLISTWNIICGVAHKHYWGAEQQAEFLRTIPIASIYAWLKPMILSIEDRAPVPKDFAQHLKTVGPLAMAATKDADYDYDKVGQVEKGPSGQQMNYFRSAWQKLKPLTHFG